MSVAIKFNKITFNAAADNAGIINGENQGFGYSSHLKANRGITVSGSRTLSTQNLNDVFDSDFIDTPINDEDLYFGQMASS